MQEIAEDPNEHNRSLLKGPSLVDVSDVEVCDRSAVSINDAASALEAQIEKENNTVRASVA